MEFETEFETVEETNVEETLDETTNGVEFTDTVATEEVETKEENISLKDILAKDQKLQEQFDKAIENRLKREKRDFEKTLASYKKTESILQAGLNTNTIDEANEKLAEFYSANGVAIPDLKGLSEKEVTILAKHEAEEIMELGYEEMSKEANELAKKGYENLDAREKVVFTTLATKLTQENQIQELKKLGVEPSVLEDNEFKEFASKFNPKVGVADIYSMYAKTHKDTKKVVEKIGSMQSEANPSKVKDFYSRDESLKFTRRDFDKNPALFKAVEQSMTKW